MQLGACCTHRDTVFERLADRFLSYQIYIIIMLTAHTIHLQQTVPHVGPNCYLSVLDKNNNFLNLNLRFRRCFFLLIRMYGRRELGVM